MSITTTDSLSGKNTPIPYCAECKQKVPDVLYTLNPNGQPVCQPCSGRNIDDLFRIVTDE